MELNGLSDFHAWLCRNVPEDSTRRTYLSPIAAFHSWLSGREATSESFGEYLMSLRKRGIAEGTEHYYVAAIKKYFEFLRKEVHLDVRLRKVPKLLPRILTDEELNRMMNFEDIRRGDFYNTRCRAMCKILYYCGFRLREFSSLMASDIDFRSKTVCVFGKGKKQRIVPITEDCLNSITTYLKHRTQFVNENLWIRENGEPLNYYSCYAILKRWAKNCGVKQWHPHKMRHTFATKMLDQGCNIRIIQELLGHSSLAATQIYTHVAVETMQREYRKYHPPKINHNATH